MVDALVAAGSNLGDRRAALDSAVALLGQRADIRITAVSRWIETPPIGGSPGQQPFLNGAIRIDTDLAPESLLDALQEIEQALGRQRGERWGPRTLDLDLLLYGDQKIRTPRLVVPHPRMAFRHFVLAPAREIAADMVHPEIGWSVERIVQHLDQAANYVAIAGPLGAGQSWLARETCTSVGAICVSAGQTWAELISAPPRTGEQAPDALGWIAEQVDRLRQIDAQTAGGQQLPVVSDFWLDACAAEADVWLSAAEAERVHSAWLKLAAERVQPKLIVLLDAPADVLQDNWRRKTGVDFDTTKLQSSRAALRQLADRGGHGPVLWLDAQDHEQMLSEICAALLALRAL